MLRANQPLDLQCFECLHIATENRLNSTSFYTKTLPTRQTCEYLQTDKQKSASLNINKCTAMQRLCT